MTLSPLQKHAHRPRPRTSDDANIFVVCNAVWETTELLEGILAHHPCKKMFAIQLVSKHWKQVTAACPEIQELLFLRTAPPLETWEVFDAESQQRIRIDLAYPRRLARHQLTTRRTNPTPEDTNSNHPVLFLPVALSPLMERHPWMSPQPRPFMEFSEQGDSYLNSARIRECVRYEGTMNSLEQCRSMHLTNTATHEAYVAITVLYQDDDASLTNTSIIAELVQLEARVQHRLEDCGRCRLDAPRQEHRPQHLRIGTRRSLLA